MSTNLTVVVAGLPGLAAVLESCGLFARVVPIASTSALRDLLASGTLSTGVGDKVFLFADTTSVDTPQSLPFLIGRLTGMRAPVVVVATSPGARDLVAQCPGAGLLEGPLKLNQVLGALSGIPGVTRLPAVADNVSIPLPGMDGPADVPSQPAAAPAPAFAAAPPAFDAAPPVFDAAPPAFTAPAPAQQPAQPAFQPPPAQSPFQPAHVQPTPDPFQPAQPPVQPAQAPGQGSYPPAFAPEMTPAPEQPPFASPSQWPASAEPAAPAGPPARRSLSSVTAQPAPAEPAEPFTAAPDAPQAPPPYDPFAASSFGAPTAEPFGGAAAQPYPGSPSDFAPSPQSPFGTPSPAAAPTMRPLGFQVNEPAPPEQSSPFGGPAPAFGSGLAARANGSQSPERPARRGRVITVTAPKGGTGKSTVSLNLAAYLGLRLRGTGRNVCIIDANVQQADTGKYLNAYTPNVESILKNPSVEIHPDRINNHLLHRPDLNLSALLGPSTPEVANPMFFTGKRYTQILEALKPNYDYILIDTPVAELYHELFRDFALPNADFILTTIAPNVATLVNTDSWLRQITAPIAADGMGIDREKIGIVLNRAQTDIGLSEDEVRRELGSWRFLGSIPETKEWQRCNNMNEIVATKNYHELNEAFALVLSYATGEELLSTTPASVATRGLSGMSSLGGLGGLLNRLIRKG